MLCFSWRVNIAHFMEPQTGRWNYRTVQWNSFGLGFHLKSDAFLLWYGKKRVMSYESWVTSYKLKAQKHKLKFKSKSWNSKVWVASSKLRVTNLNLRVTSSNARIIKAMKAQVNSLKSSWFPEIISPKLFSNLWGNWFVQFLVKICFRFSLFHGYGFSRKLSK